MSTSVPPELAAILDVLDRELIPSIDDCDGPRADALRSGAAALKARVKELTDGVDAKLMSLAERAPLKVPGRTYVAERESKATADHAAIEKQIIDTVSKPDEDGVVPTARSAATWAVRLMHELYVTPSKVPSAKAIKATGITGAIEWKDGGWKLTVIEQEVRE